MKISDFRGKPVVARWTKRDGKTTRRYITPTLTRHPYIEVPMIQKDSNDQPAEKS